MGGVCCDALSGSTVRFQRHKRHGRQKKKKRGRRRKKLERPRTLEWIEETEEKWRQKIKEESCFELRCFN